ncbi:MAG TPA: beta-ketoacyl-ACP synthase II [Syntrophales bacterium]|nr:beta-ketoacyl-ACP synthase II [Syntrophales bacterium]
MERRVVITGMGTVNPVGNNVDETWAALCAGLSGIGPITKFDPGNQATKIAGELKKFNPLLYVDKKELRRLDDFIIYALACADMAMKDSGLVIDEANAERVGTIIGSGIGGVRTIEREHTVLEQSGPRRVSPFTIPAVLPNLAAGQVSIRHKAKGPISCPVTACAAGTSAIGEAFRAIQGGWADTMIAGGIEAAITPFAIAGFNAMRALSTRNDEPAKASRPFDRDRDGFVMGEGGGILILEELTLARKRDARVYAELCGYGCTADAYHMAAPPPGHEGAARSMEIALKSCGMGPSEVGYINAHGTATPLNDVYETQAIKRVFGAHSRKLAVSSTKSMTGHLLGGAGGLEAIVAVKAVCEGVAPPTINLDNPEEGCDLNYVAHRAMEMNIEAALSNTFGFGGVNAVLVFKKFRD